MSVYYTTWRVELPFMLHAKSRVCNSGHLCVCVCVCVCMCVCVCACACRCEYLFNFDNTFEIHDDIEVLKRMGMSLRLENGSCGAEGLTPATVLLAPAAPC